MLERQGDGKIVRVTERETIITLYTLPCHLRYCLRPEKRNCRRKYRKLTDLERIRFSTFEKCNFHRLSVLENHKLKTNKVHSLYCGIRWPLFFVTSVLVFKFQTINSSLARRFVITTIVWYGTSIIFIDLHHTKYIRFYYY